MNIGLAFWIIMLVWLIFGFITSWPRSGEAGAWTPFAGNLLMWVLFLLVGWKVFGAPLHG